MIGPLKRKSRERSSGGQSWVLTIAINPPGIAWIFSISLKIVILNWQDLFTGVMPVATWASTTEHRTGRRRPVIRGDTGPTDTAITMAMTVAIGKATGRATKRAIAKVIAMGTMNAGTGTIAITNHHLNLQAGGQDFEMSWPPFYW